MKLVIASIHPTKLKAVRDALVHVEVERMTVCDAIGFGPRHEQTEMFRGHPCKKPLRKVLLEIVVNDDFLDRTVQTIVNAARTGSEGNIGDGKVFVLPVAQTIQIGGQETGPGAV